MIQDETIVKSANRTAEPRPLMYTEPPTCEALANDHQNHAEFNPALNDSAEIYTATSERLVLNPL